jgi:hypothetical protein
MKSSYNVWVISPSFPHSLPYLPCPLPLTPYPLTARQKLYAYMNKRKKTKKAKTKNNAWYA